MEKRDGSKKTRYDYDKTLWAKVVSGTRTPTPEEVKMAEDMAARSALTAQKEEYCKSGYGKTWRFGEYIPPHEV